MIADDLRHVVSVEVNTPVADGLGGFTDSWGTVSGLGTLRVAIWPIGARERVENQQIEHEITHRVRTWYRSAIEPKHRIKYHDYRKGADRYFEIKSIINPNEDGRLLDLICEEIDE